MVVRWCRCSVHSCATRVTTVSIRGPTRLAKRSTVVDTSGRRRAKPRRYPSISAASRAYPDVGRSFGVIVSSNSAGSSALAPYTAVVDSSTTRRTDGAFWHAASSCIVPMTLISFMVARPPASSGVARTAMCTTVSTSAWAITLPITGLRMSARTNSASPRSCLGGTTSTPITREMSGSACSSWVNRPPR